MKTKLRMRKWLSVLLCACLLFINIDSTAFADDEDPVSSLGVDPVTGTTTNAEKTVLLAGKTNSLRKNTLGETIQKYRETYLLGIAADFSVFLAGDFTPTDSDTEGRAAIGGNIILSELHWEGNSYAFGAGDYRTVVPLDTLLKFKNGTGTATVILGGEVVKGQLSDVYYEGNVKYESVKGKDELGNRYENPLRKSSKILVLNTNGGTPDWVTSTGAIPENSYQAEWQKMDLSQTYVTKLFDFTEQFDYLKETSNKLPQLADEGNTVTYENGTITFKYGGDHNVPKECVYFNLPADMLDKFAAARKVVFENIPNLPEARTVIDRDGNPQPWAKAYIVVNIDGSNGIVNLSDSDKSTEIAEIDISNVINNYGVSSLMYNVYNATEVYLANGNFQGTVFAPGAAAKDNATNGDNNHGHLSGALIAQSFKGGTEFGYYPFTGPGLKEGSLKVSKTVTGNAGDKAKDFTFTVTLDNKSINGTYGDMTFTNGVATFKLKHGESKTATGLPAGITYKVEESDSTGYTVTSKDATDKTTEGKVATGTIPVGDEAIVEFTNYKATGNLKVSKTVSGNAGEKSKGFPFTVTLYDGDIKANITGTYGEMTFTDGVAEFTLKDGESKEATGLPAGITYKVEESGNEGYTVTSTGKNGTIEEGATAKAEFTNYKATGSLTVTKTVIGNAGDKEKEFTFTVTLDDKTITGTYSGVEFEAGVGIIKLKHGESKTIDGLPAGIKYTVEESDNEGYTVTSKDATDKTTEGKVATGTIPEDATAKAEFTNTRDGENTGDLVVSKTVTGNAGETDKYFKFTVTLSGDTIPDNTYGDMTFENGEATFTLKDGESKTADGLPAGLTYTVVESDNEGYTVTLKDATGGTLENATGTIVNNNPAVVEFINHKDVGSLKVSKTVEGRDGETDKYFTFTVTLYDGGRQATTINETYSDVEFEAGVGTIELKHDESKKIDGLPAGLTYTVVESDNTGYTVTTRTGDSGTIPVGGEVEAKFTNTRDVGDLTVSKTVGGTGGDRNKYFTFTVTLSDGANQATSINGIYGADGGMEFQNGVATFTLKDGESKTATGLPTGLTYTVEESDNKYYTVTSKDQTGAITNGEKATGTIENNKTATAKFTNTRDSGSLIVSKSVPETIGDKQKEFTFTVTLDDKTITGTYGSMEFKDGVATFALKHGESKKATGLPEGITYTVVESGNDDYDVTSTGETGTIEKDKEAEAKFTNTRHVGSLIVSKKVTGTGGETDKEFTFTVTLSGGTIPNDTYGDMTFKNNVATFTLKDGEHKKATGLPTGISYTVKEVDDKNYTATFTGATGTIEKGTEAEAEFTNTRKEGDLTVSKTVIGTAGEKDKEFTFTVTLSGGTIPDDTYGDMTFKNNVATFTLKHGESKTATGLPAGMGYTVEEQMEDSDGYAVTSTGETGTISANVTATAEFINALDGLNTGDLIVSKTVAGRGGETDKVFKFTVTLSDKTNDKTYSGVKFTAGVATIELKHGERKTIEGLPAGLSYTVVESGNEGYTVTSTGETGTIEQNNPATAAFTNTRNVGKLTVSKTVTGTGGDKDKLFTFTVTLSDKSINGIYGDMTFDKGVATFTLKHDENMTAEELPEGITYTVVESGNEDYTVTATGEKGTIEKNKTATAAFTNRKDLGQGGLTVSKEVTGTAGDKEQEFTFTVTLSDTSIKGIYGDMEFKNGVATFTLIHGDSKTAEKLPEGITYTVDESDNAGYTVTKSGYKGTIAANTTAIAKFTNKKNSVGLTVTETVIGDDGKDKEFTFTVTLEDDTINGTYGDMTFENGKASFTLKDGESKTAKDLPSGLKYKVEQTDNEGYTQSVTGETGMIPDGALATAKFVNTRNVKNSSSGTSGSKNTSTSNNTSVAAANTEQTKTTVVLSGVVRTGDDSHLGLWIVLLTLALVGLGTGFYFKKRSSSR